MTNSNLLEALESVEVAGKCGHICSVSKVDAAFGVIYCQAPEHTQTTSVTGFDAAGRGNWDEAELRSLLGG